MSKFKNFLNRFSMFNLIMIAMMASLGIATKPIIVPLVHIITGPLFIPGGAVAGGFYMLWIVLGIGFVKRPGTGTLIAFVQAVLVLSVGLFGTHGFVSLITYSLPGLAADIPFLFSKKKNFNLLHYFFSGAAANLTGTYLSNLAFFRLPLVPLLLSLSCAALSGGLGGIIAYNIVKRFKHLNMTDNKREGYDDF